ncbi:hypothetical protein [Armatimonas rosea]|uniref:Uncharacterized protein n=1 Tax=Armatimonas rosea TaxID=685828 RepID=A0A7W9W9X6_ARMRO|nr:hypothetical protein [Armatimonas rosea]MBB6053685.1 hypothetical protein [Armatimonas rosea]
MDTFFSYEPPLTAPEVAEVSTDVLGWLLLLDNEILDAVGGNAPFLQQFFENPDHYIMEEVSTDAVPPELVSDWARRWQVIWSASHLPELLVDNGLMDWWDHRDRQAILRTLDRLQELAKYAQAQGVQLTFAVF